jgi:hypothetical protein
LPAVLLALENRSTSVATAIRSWALPLSIARAEIRGPVLVKAAVLGELDRIAQEIAPTSDLRSRDAGADDDDRARPRAHRLEQIIRHLAHRPATHDRRARRIGPAASDTSLATARHPTAVRHASRALIVLARECERLRVVLSDA